MKLWEHYHSPKTVSEAEALLRKYKGEARVLGGGIDLLLEIKQGKHPEQYNWLLRFPGA